MAADTVTLQARESSDGSNPVDRTKGPMTRLKHHFNGPKNLFVKEFFICQTWYITRLGTREGEKSSVIHTE